MAAQTKDRPQAAASHAQVARDLGINFSMVSRLRTGKRAPSVSMIDRISKRYDWGADEQVASVVAGTFDRDFEVILVSHYGEKEE